jgi:hypothetical protein
MPTWSKQAKINELDDKVEQAEVPLTKKDSLIQLAEKLDIEIEDDSDVSIHEILDLIIEEKESILVRLNELDASADDTEKLAYEYKKKRDEQIRLKLLERLKLISDELELIKIESKYVRADSLSRPEQIIPESTETIEGLKRGKYVARLDSTTVVSFLVPKDGADPVFGEPRLDSTTIINSRGKLHPRLKKELDVIKKRLEQEKNQ